VVAQLRVRHFLLYYEIELNFRVITIEAQMTKPQILLTNDDGIQSPGIWAAAETLSELGFVHVAAPRDQSSGAGRSLPTSSDGTILERIVTVNEKDWTVHAVGGTPAQTVMHAVLEILPEPPSLVVAGINYGENLGSGVTISGTVGAALEAASFGIPAMAVSLETEPRHHYTHSDEVDFTVAAYFTAYFGRLLLEKKLPQDVEVLKIEIPCDASPTTPWLVTRLSHLRYFEPVAPERISWDSPTRVGYRLSQDLENDDPDSDVYVVRVRRCVSVTPLSLDMTSRIDLNELDRLLRA
jgi:5'-nucleotidase